MFQVMTCRLFGAEPLPETMMTSRQLDPKEHNSVIFESKQMKLRPRKSIGKCRLQNSSHFVRTTACSVDHVQSGVETCDLSLYFISL